MDTQQECVICAFPFDNTERLHALSICGHKDVCSICFLKIRAIQRNFNCPSCKTSLEKVICCSDPTVNFTDFNIWGDSIGPDFTYDERGQIFFPTDYYKSKIQSLWLCKCKICNHTKRDLKGLRTHCQKEHNLELCLLCIENRNSFPSEFKCYNQNAYSIHLRAGDGDGSQGHPNCEFCRKRYYDKTALFNHLQQDHFSCHICSKQGILYKYYAKYDHLETHFRVDHFLCEDQKCLDKKFVVFVNQIDLAAHDRQWHPFGNSSSQQQQRPKVIPMQFRVRRQGDTTDDPSLTAQFGGDGTNNVGNNNTSSSTYFDGGLGGRAHDGEWQIQLSYVATDPRDANRSTGLAGAAELENLTNSSNSASGSSGSSANGLMSAGTEEEFPALPSDSRVGSGMDRNLWGGKVKVQSSRNNDYPTLGGGGSGSAAGGMKKKASTALTSGKSSSSSSSSSSSFQSSDFPSLSSNTSANSSFKAAVNDDVNTSLAVRKHMQRSSATADDSTATTTGKDNWKTDINSTEEYPGLTSSGASKHNISSSSSFTSAATVETAIATATATTNKASVTTSSTNTTVKKPSSSSQKAKPSTPAAQSASHSSWGTALSAAGMANAVKKPPPPKPGISVAKLSKKSNSTSNLDEFSTQGNSGGINNSNSNSNSNSNGSSNLVALENMVPIDRNTHEKYTVPPGLVKSTVVTTASNNVSGSTGANTSIKERKVGNWVTAPSIGGAPKNPLTAAASAAVEYSNQVTAKLSDNEYPSLSSGSSNSSGKGGGNSKNKKSK